MRTTWLSTTLTAAACGSLVLGVAGPALAEAPAAAPGARTEALQRNEVPVALEEIRTLVSRITREARSGSADTATLRDLQRQLDRPAERLLDDIAARPKAAPMAPDPAAEIKQALDKLIKDVSKLLDDVAKKDTAATDASAADAIKDLNDMLTKIPGLVSGAIPSLPVPSAV
ncbi:hypothetical protein SMD11_0839 [Streptomyces albireticuli]|uniref:Secreted protein n=1 Tax=Streptomyces albireticuli TaxID=1940 RepID=A0A1Z2KWT4_9ACTN|nr:hypothetical protein [Streptomyces albireticuli]ARZ66505.1 hypothetical protein SMD11_0839 [Streptomyces albireticuli]